jgi:GNAT superfamily N-acetyltransferase
MDQDQLAALLIDDRVAVHVLYAAGVPAGYLELDARQAGDIEIAYFGLMPEFIGQRLGPYLLGWGVAEAWRAAPARLWVHTCTLDHPRALAAYLAAGFVEYDRTASPPTGV